MSAHTTTPSLSQSQTSTQVQLKTQESALQGLLAYCDEQSVYINPAIAAQNFPGRGLGIYTVKAIKKGEKLIHVPTKSLLTTQSIPEVFLSKQIVKKKLSVHCALAAYLAFGGEEVSKKYGRWMDTWPKFEEFTESMPVFWWEDFRFGGEDKSGSEKRAKKRRKTINEEDVVPDMDIVAKDVGSVTKPATTLRFSLSPAVDGRWLTIPVLCSPAQSSTTPDLLSAQAQKLRSCVAMVSKYLPDLNIYSPTSRNHYLRFLYAWSIVNTRCFYYLHPGQAPPEDSNEAMALCPFQDLFNHSPSRGCVGAFDKRGFYVTADKDYPKGVELFINYGRHGNDALWTEYGFYVNENKDDALSIENIVLSSDNGCSSDEDRQALEKAGYLGGYTLKKDGVCYRTIMASYLGILDSQQWTRMASGGFDPETSTAHALLKLRSKRRIVDWILKLRREAERNLEILVVEIGAANEDLLVAALIGDASLTDEQRGSTEKKVELARRRHEVCVKRWMQILELCNSAFRAIQRECPDAFVIDGDVDGNGIEAGLEAKDRKKNELETTAEQFVDSLKSNKAGKE